ncbi:bifunctional enoyl-CoA hydratase/phosphate acetyltransferase [Pseudoruegeria sp. SHC-113]|uniref:bifunctional enoyl-CoA hydratase/phosphate acetyltransferase n=1 Tax=Pseudoruegeria sp. SHC-113 TaxID=2855439 RepID=UPI0021BA814D|nr:bifunctional enoyl-CoA hydratase/phosphate acetyltransferase [Pseudoruegeria sp. SHC-113]MCT8160903.1 bifunctional enoyl-CoA hydratase/phosphate acetyltransferase [Pseudoruegeria sp. SHC-113]
MDTLENRTFDEISPGDSATLSRTLTTRDIDLFAVMSGDVNPSHMDAEFAAEDSFHRIVGHGMWGGALFSTLLGTELPGAGTIYLGQSLRFHGPMGLGDTVTVRVTVREKHADGHRVIFDCLCAGADGTPLITGEAEVTAPTEKIRRAKVDLPEVHLRRRGGAYEALIRATDDLEPIRTAVVHPCDAVSLAGALQAAEMGLITPVLVGPETRIRAVAEAEGLSLAGVDLVDSAHSHASAEEAVALVRAGKAEALMKGALHTDEVMSAVVDRAKGLRTERRMSHVFAMDVPSYPKPLFITDAAINIFPDLAVKADIVQNAIELVRCMGVEVPKVAILSAVETIMPNIPSTVEASALCKMADRGQITGGVLDGPLAFDNAISLAAAQTKGIVSPVAGQADILVAPDLEAGNMIAKQLMYLAGAASAGLVLGARVPIMLTSRADGEISRVASAAMAQLFVRRRAAGGVA